jgi:4-amino-4-deoxy-L-arabinose transferase-like glycosyltransferase
VTAAVVDPAATAAETAGVDLRTAPRPMTAERADPRTRDAWTEPSSLLMVVALLIGVATVVATTPIGSGDYGQWLMTSRPFLGQSTPAYRDIADVPPLVPVLIAGVRLAVPDPVLAMRAVAMSLTVLVGLGFYLAAASLADSRRAGLIAASLALLATDQYLGLFTFGGLLQAAAVGLLALALAAFSRAAHGGRRGWALWVAGGLALVLTAMSHLATGAIGLVAGAVVAVLAVFEANEGWTARARAFLPVAICLALVGTWWVLVLLPGSGAYINNPASLNYRGPDRLAAILADDPLNTGLIAFGAVCLVAGMAAELARRHAGSMVMVAGWAAVTAVVLGWSIVSGVATDYPRFSTVLLAPLIVACAIGTVRLAGWIAARGRMRARTRALRVPRLAWRRRRAIGLLVATALVLALAPGAVARYRTDARGYEVTDMAGLTEAARWIAAQTPPSSSVLAPAREAKWIEGLTGRSAVFDNPIRYSFRPGEWRRSLDARAMLQSTATLMNGDFQVRLLGGDPCGTGIAADAMVVGANHGGEFVDLLQLTAARSLLVDRQGATVATVGSLRALSGKPLESGGSAVSEVTATEAWTGGRQGSPVTVHEAISLRANASTLELNAVATTPLPVDAIELALRPAAGVAITQLTVDGDTAVVEFTQLGRTNPRLRLTVANGGALHAQPDGTIVARSVGPRMRLLVTDLTASQQSVTGLVARCPAALAQQYQLAAVLLRNDASLPERMARMAAIGFTNRRDFGAYVVLTRATREPPA